MFKLNNKNEIKDSNEVVKNVNKKTSIPSILNAEVFFKGDLFSENIIEIFGKVEGSIKAEFVSLRLGSEVKGDIFAKYIKIAGKFEGKINSSIVHITSSGCVNGDLTYGILSIEEKAKFEGTLSQKPELLHAKEIEDKKNDTNKARTENADN